MNTKKKSPILSICIPTYNREKLLMVCLNSIVKQFKNQDILDKVEIVISNNNSQDKTEEIIKEFQKNFKNIFYYKNKKNIGIKNTVKVATYAKGEYIWFFSDDDIHKNNSLKTVLRVIETYHPDSINTNLDLVDATGKKTIGKNVLRSDKDVLIQNKVKLFSFLEKKFFLPIDWYLTCYSITILRRKLFSSGLLKKFSDPKNIFPHTSFIYYTSDNFTQYMIAKPLVLFRADNRSFGPQNKVEFLLFWYPVLDYHYRRISNFNKKYMSLKFRGMMYLKKLTRDLRLTFLKIFKVDISDFLIKIFEKK